MRLLDLDRFGITSPNLVLRGVIDRSSVEDPEDLLQPSGDSGEVPAILKGYEDFGLAKAVDEEERSFQAIASARTVDRDGDVIEPSAFKHTLKQYQRNPVMPFAHDIRFPPVARSEDHKITKKTFEIKAVFGSTPFAEEIFTLYSEGIMNALSVGFIAVAVDKEPVLSGQTGVTFTKLDLLEISCVVVPSNRDALVRRGSSHTRWIARAVGEIEGDHIQRDERIRAAAKHFGLDLDHRGFVALGSNIYEDSETFPEPDITYEWNEKVAKDLEDEDFETKTVLPYRNLPVDRNRAWDAGAARKRVRAWATSGDSVNTARYSRAFVVRTGDPENLTSYKLPIADVVSGRLTCIFRALPAVIAVLNGARGGMNLSDADRRGAYNHVVRYYRKVDEEPPPLKDTGELREEEISMPVRAKIYGTPKTAEEALSNIFRAYELDTLFETEEDMQRAMAECISVVRELSDEEEVNGIPPTTVRSLKAAWEALEDVLDVVTDATGAIEQTLAVEDYEDAEAEAEETDGTEEAEGEADVEVEEESEESLEGSQEEDSVAEEDREALLHVAQKQLLAIIQNASLTEEEKNEKAREIEEILAEAGIE